MIYSLNILFIFVELMIFFPAVLFEIQIKIESFNSKALR